MALSGQFRSNLSLITKVVKAESVLAQRSGLLGSSEKMTFGSSFIVGGIMNQHPHEFHSIRKPITVNPETRSFQGTNHMLVKNYATATPSKEVKVRVPLALFGGSGNYASALYIAATKSNLLEKVESEMIDLVEASKKSPLFTQFIRDLSVPGETRVKAIKDITSQAKFTEITTNFLAVLADNGRLRHIDTITKRFVELTMAHKGEVKAIVTTVIPLPAEEEKQLKETLQEIIGHGKKVKLEQKIDPSILGGLVVEFSQKVFDMSIRTRARQMERFLRDPINFDSV